MKPVDEKLWNSWKDAIRSRARLTKIDAKSVKDTTVFGMTGGDDTPWTLSIRRYRRYSVGIDIVGYTKRSWEGQLFLTTNLLVAIDAARDVLRKIGWIGTAQPDVFIPTGDGAILLFETLQEALPMLFAVNMLIEDMNRGPFGGVDPEVEAAQEYPILPCHVRYALAVGEVGNITAVAAVPNAVGPGVSNCARILDASKGAHFLIQDEVMRELIGQGGINEVADHGDQWDWGQDPEASPHSGGSQQPENGAKILVLA